MTARASFTKADVTRLVRGVEAAGMKVAQIEYDGTKIVILTEASDEAEKAGAKNPWDEVFDETPPA